MLRSVPHTLAIGHPNDFTLFNYGLLLLFRTKCSASSGVETPGVEMCLTPAETPSKNDFSFM